MQITIICRITIFSSLDANLSSFVHTFSYLATPYMLETALAVQPQPNATMNLESFL